MLPRSLTDRTLTHLFLATRGIREGTDSPSPCSSLMLVARAAPSIDGMTHAQFDHFMVERQEEAIATFLEASDSATHAAKLNGQIEALMSATVSQPGRAVRVHALISRLRELRAGFPGLRKFL